MAPSSPRNGARVIWVTVHTAEGIRKATDLKAFFDRSTGSSAHAVADDGQLIDNLVPYERSAWTLRNGNGRSDNLELCGFASWSRDEWIRNHQGMLRNAAAWIRSRCQARGIPIRKIGPTEVARGEAGVIGHVDYTNGAHDGTHWDPGPGFPWDVVMSMAANGSTPPPVEDDMYSDEDRVWDRTEAWRLYALMTMSDSVSPSSPAGKGETVPLVAALKGLVSDVAALKARPPVVAAPPVPAVVDYVALAKAVCDEQDRRGRDGDAKTGPSS